MRKLIAGNWKMNGLAADGLALARSLVRRVSQAAPPCDLLICPPATLLISVAGELRGSPIALGGQDCHSAPSGAHTGDVGAPMLRDAGCAYVILGHSERRTNHHESDDLVRAKVSAARVSGLISVVCVGETAAEREQGSTLEIVSRQLAGSIPDGIKAAEFVVAYEPVWAIGSGRTPDNAEIAEVHAHMRTHIDGRTANGGAVRLLYGGSVNAKNAAELMKIENVDGALVGGASLDADSFWSIAQSCA